MSEYSNRHDRGRLVGLVFSMQALGLIVGPLVALPLLSSGIGDSLTWPILLGLGAVPAAAVVYLRSRMPEPPRYLAQVQGEHDRAAGELEHFSQGVIVEPNSSRFRFEAECGLALSLPTRTCSNFSSGWPEALVPLRLRLLRQHPLPSRHLERGGRHGQLGDKAAVVTWDVRDLRSPWLVTPPRSTEWIALATAASNSSGSRSWRCASSCWPLFPSSPRRWRRS